MEQKPESLGKRPLAQHSDNPAWEEVLKHDLPSKKSVQLSVSLLPATDKVYAHGTMPNQRCRCL